MVEVHRVVVEEKVLCDAAPEIAFPMRTDADRPLLSGTMPPLLSHLEEKIDSIVWQMPEIERKFHQRQSIKVLMNPLA